MTQPIVQPGPAHATGAYGELVYDPRCWYCRHGLSTESPLEQTAHQREVSR